MNIAKLRELNDIIETKSREIDLLGKLADTFPDIRIQCLEFQTKIAHDVNEMVNDIIVYTFKGANDEDIQSENTNNEQARNEDRGDSNLQLSKADEANKPKVPAGNPLEMLLRKVIVRRGYINASLLAFFLFASCQPLQNTEKMVTAHADSMRAMIYDRWFQGVPRDTIDFYFAFSEEDRVNYLFVDSVIGKTKPPCDMAPDYCECMFSRNFFPKSCLGM